MTSQTKCIELITQKYNYQTGVYAVSYFDSNIEDSPVIHTEISEEQLLTYISDNELNHETFINYNAKNSEDDGLDQRYISPSDYLEDNSTRVLTEYIEHSF